MKKYIIAGMLLLLPTVSYAKGCDCCVEKYFMYTPINATTTTFGTMIMRGYACGSKSLNDTGIKKLIGKMVHRTKPIDLRGSIADRSYIDEPRKLLAVTDEYLILSSDILARGQFEIDRAIWDDGNWEEVKPQRLTVVEEEISKILKEAMPVGTYTFRMPPIKIKCELVGRTLYTTLFYEEE